MNTKGTGFLRIPNGKEVINKPCDLGDLSRQQQSISGKDLRLVSLASTLTGYFWFPHLKNGGTGQGPFILQLAVG